MTTALKYWLLVTFLLAIAGCGTKDDKKRQAQPFEEFRLAVPEFIFQVDFSAPAGGQEFWFEWSEAKPVVNSKRQAQTVFDQNALDMRLTTCLDYVRTGNKEHKDCYKKAKTLQFVQGEAVSSPDLANVLDDGVVVHANAKLDLDPLPRGSYEIEFFFHNSTDFDLGAVEILRLDTEGKDSDRSLGAVVVSQGTNGEQAATLTYRFDVFQSQALRFKFICLQNGYIINGFRLSKFFGEPEGEDPNGGGDGGPDKGDGEDGGDSGDGSTTTTERVDFNEAKRWSPFFASGQPGPNLNDIAWTDFDRLPRLVGDVSGDGLADIVGFASNGVYVAKSNGQSFEVPRLWLVDFGSEVGGFSSQESFPRQLADVNGDGRLDIIGFGPDGVSVALSESGVPERFASPIIWTNDFVGEAWASSQLQPRFVIDQNGDDRADVLAVNADGVFLALNQGDRFASAVKLLGAAELPHLPSEQTPFFAGDVNGDGLADLIGASEFRLWFLLSRSAAEFWPLDYGPRFFVPADGWQSNVAQPRFVEAFGLGSGLDMLGLSEGKMYLAYDLETADKRRELPGISSFLTSRDNLVDFDFNRSPIAIADVNGDRFLDLIFFQYDGVYVAAGRIAD